MAEDQPKIDGGPKIPGKYITTFLPDKTTVNLSEFIKQRRVDYANFLKDCSPISVHGIWQYIAEYVLDEEVLIPNTTNVKEFCKYWYIVPNGTSETNRFRQYHDVKVRTPITSEHIEIELIRRGAIASIKEYIPSKNAKLRIQCEIRWKHRNDFITFLTTSDGTRRTNGGWGEWGEVNHGGRVLMVVQYGWGLPGLYMFLGEGTDRGWPETRHFMGTDTMPRPPCKATVEIIDDGETVEMYYDNGLIQYTLVQKEVSAGNSNHIAIFNREQQGNVCDITSLIVSVVMG